MANLTRTTSLEQFQSFLQQEFSISSSLGSGRNSPDPGFVEETFDGSSSVESVEKAVRRRFGVELILLDRNGLRCRREDPIGTAGAGREPVDAAGIDAILEGARLLGAGRGYSDADELRMLLDRAAARVATADGFVALAACASDLAGGDGRWDETDLFAFLDRHAAAEQRRSSLAAAAEASGDRRLLRWLGSASPPPPLP